MVAPTSMIFVPCAEGLTVTPGVVDFGPVVLGRAATQTVVVLNPASIFPRRFSPSRSSRFRLLTW